MTADDRQHNYSRRFTLDNLDIRGQVVRLTDVWRDMHGARHYPAHIRQFLGELACVAVLVGAGLKRPGRAALQIQPKRKISEGGAETFSGPSRQVVLPNMRYRTDIGERVHRHDLARLAALGWL